MVTEKDLYDGLILCCTKRYSNPSDLYEIKELRKGIISSTIHKKDYYDYHMSKILNYINSGDWFIYNKERIYELW